MKVFISWSGNESRCAAIALRDWLPNVIQAIDPYVSSEDIDKGARWSSDISSELEASEFGILCITAENLHAPWVSFEAGALSKSLEQSRVSPFLVGIDRTQVTGPLLQFQSTINEHDDVLKLVKSINKSAGDQGLDEARLDAIFEVWWPKLSEALEQCEGLTHPVPEPARDEDDLLAEILELVREQQRLLRNPEAILPIDYFRFAMDEVNSRDLPPGLFHDLDEIQHWLRMLAGEFEVLDPEQFMAEARRYADDLQHVVEYLTSRHGARRAQRPRRNIRNESSSSSSS